MKKEATKSLAPAKKKNGIKIVMKRRKKSSIQRSTCGLSNKTIVPEIARGRSRKTIRSILEEEEDSIFDASSEILQDLPSDTLLLLQSIQQSQQCVFIPLKVNSSRLVPAVLESQLYSKLEASDAGDSIVTQELQDLAEDNKIRRLVSANGRDIVAWMETQHYISAVKDANEYYSSNQTSATSLEENQKSSKVISWFLKNLSKWTKKTISEEALKEALPTKQMISLVQCIDILVKHQILLPYKTKTYLFWLPHWGTVLSSISEAQNKILAQIKRSSYKELSVKAIESFQYTGMSASFILHTLQAQGKIRVISRPAGNFAKLPKV